MTDRSFRLRVAGIGAVAVLAVAVAVVIGAVALGIDTEVNAFYSSIVGNDEPSTAQYDEMNALATTSYALRGMTAPLVFAALVAIFVALGLLAMRWRPQPRPETP